MAVRDWIYDFLDAHAARFGPYDWPEQGTDEWDVFVRGWVRAFIESKVEHAEADSASERLMHAPPRFRRDHLPAVIAVVEQRRRPKFDAYSVTLSQAESRQRQAAMAAREEARLAELWAELTEYEQAEIRAGVLRENPGLLRFEPFVRRLCLEHMKERAW